MLVIRSEISASMSTNPAAVRRLAAALESHAHNRITSPLGPDGFAGDLDATAQPVHAYGPDLAMLFHKDMPSRGAPIAKKSQSGCTALQIFGGHSAEQEASASRKET